MAEDAELKLKDEKGGSKKLIIIIAGVVLLVIIGVLVFLLLGKDAPTGEGGSQPMTEEEIAAAKEANKIYYVPLQNPLLFNASAKPKGHLVQIKFSLQVRGSKNEAFAKHHLPAIESAIADVFSSVTYDDILAVEGRDELKMKCLTAVQAKLLKLENEPIVEKLLYDGFVIQ